MDETPQAEARATKSLSRERFSPITKH